MPTKKLLPNEQIINTIIERDLWKVTGIAVAMEGSTKRKIIEKALTEYLVKHHPDLVGAKKERTWQDGPDTNHPFDFSELD